MTPAYARAPRGQRAVDSAPASWETVTVIAALGRDGVRAPLAFPGSTDTAAFRTYVEQALVPELHEGDVVVFDNLKPHLTAGVAESSARARARVLPLPPYSPDYTPIEEMFSKVKQGLRRAGARAKAELYEALGETLRGERHRRWKAEDSSSSCNTRGRSGRGDGRGPDRRWRRGRARPARAAGDGPGGTVRRAGVPPHECCR
jgi:transposase